MTTTPTYRGFSMNLAQRRYAFAATALRASLATPQAWAQASLQLINEYPATSITAAADLKFAEAVKQASNGSLAVQTLQEKQNPYKGDEQVNAVITGKTQKIGRAHV